jgi:Cof subfamily protein (haloacid dehalogenase superfamily)
VPIPPTAPALVFFDIDGTLLDPEKRIPDSAYAAITRLRQNGHLAFLNTGRPISSIPQDILQGPFDGVVASCGTYIEWQGETLLDVLIEPDIVDEIVRLTTENKVDVWFEGPEHVYLADLNPPGFLGQMVRYFSELKGVLVDWHKVPIKANKLSYYLPPESNLQACLPFLEQYFTLISHLPEHGEIVPQGYTKATGIQFFLNHLDLPRTQTYAFGDSLNDIEMLSFAQVGIAMGNSRHRVLQICDHVTGTPEDHGIADALRHFQLI